MLNIRYIAQFNGTAWVVTRVKTYRQDIVGSYPTNVAAMEAIDFWKSMDLDKARDRAGY